MAFFFFFFSLAASDGISFCSQAANPSFWVKIGRAPRPCEAWFFTSPVVATTGDSLGRSGLGWLCALCFVQHQASRVLQGSFVSLY